MAKTSNEKRLSLKDSAFKISMCAGTAVDPSTVRRAAKRLGELHQDGIRPAVVDEMARNYAALGVFTRRGQRSIDNLVEAVR